MAEKVLPSFKNWTFKFPKNIREEDAIIIIDNRAFTDEQCSEGQLHWSSRINTVQN